jgi:hypothetical protein
VAVSAEAIDEFWRWWATTKDAFGAAFTARTDLEQALIESMSAQVEAIHEALDWEFGPGARSEHRLCLSGKGDPQLRVVAERWVKRGPSADATWEYYPSRQAHPADDGVIEIEIGDLSVSLGELVFAVEEDDSREVLDVRGFHPLFPTITDEGLRGQILYIALDNLLGEDGVERWLGSVDLSTEPIPTGLSCAGLRERVDALESRATGEQWAVLKAMHDGKPVFVSANRALKRIDHLLLDMSLVVDLPLRTPTLEGLTTTEEGEELNDLQDELVRSLGEHAVLAGRETTAGHRTIHLRVMEGGPARSIVERWAARHPERAASIQAEMDVQWASLHRWR